MRCFQRCHAIKSIYIPASLEDIGYDAIVSGPYLESIKVGEGNSKYADWGNCLVWLTFSGCTSLKAIVIPKSMRFGIDLDDCVNLESITLPKDKRELFKDLEGKVNFIEILE